MDTYLPAQCGCVRTHCVTTAGNVPAYADNAHKVGGESTPRLLTFVELYDTLRDLH